MCSKHMKTIKKFFNYSHYVVFTAINVFVIAVFYIFGSNLNSTKLDAKLLSMTGFGKNEDYMHLTITSKETGNVEYSTSNGVCYKYYDRRGRIRCYSKMDETANVQFEGKEFETFMCASPVYNDYEKSEYLRLPMYLHDFSIKKGPQYGAKYAAYISSYTADQMLLEFGLESYDEILSIHKPFTMKIDDKEYSMSINNIYLNNKTTNWNQDISNYEDEYFLYFGKYNQSGVFTYSSAVYDEMGKTVLCADLKPNYSHYSALIKECLKQNKKPINIQISRNNETKNFSFSDDETTNNFTSQLFIMCYAAEAVMLLSIVVLIAVFKEIRKNMLKITGVLIVAFIIYAIVFEIFIGLNPFNQTLLALFNVVSNASSIIYLLNLLIVALIFYQEKPDNNIKKKEEKDGDK